MKKLSLVLALALVLITPTEVFAELSKFRFLSDRTKNLNSPRFLYAQKQRTVGAEISKYVNNKNLRLKDPLYLDCSNLEIMEMMDISMSNGSFRWILTEQSLEKTSPSPSNPESLKLKDPNVAAFYALVPGFFVHGAGHFYGGDSRTGTILLCTETFSFIVLFGFFGRAIEELSGDAVTFMKGPNIRLGAGLVLFLGSWYYDIFHSPKAAKAYNEKLLTKKRVGLKINPSGINIVFEFN